MEGRVRGSGKLLERKFEDSLGTLIIASLVRFHFSRI